MTARQCEEAAHAPSGSQRRPTPGRAFERGDHGCPVRPGMSQDELLGRNGCHQSPRGLARTAETCPPSRCRPPVLVVLERPCGPVVGTPERRLHRLVQVLKESREPRDVGKEEGDRPGR